MTREDIHAAADRIEALEGEVAEANRIVKTYYAENERLEAALDAAEARAERLQAEIDNIKQVEFPKRAENITRHLTARAERLRVALSDALSWISGCVVSGQYPGWVAAARKALEDDKQ